MAWIFVSVGSNIQRDANIRHGVAALRNDFTDVRLSTVYESEAVGFSGENFYNLVVRASTHHDAFTVAAILRRIEDQFARNRKSPRFSSRTLDLDLLLYDDLVIEQDGLSLPRQEISNNAFVLEPLAEIAGDQRHPVSGERYQDLWRAFDKASQPLWPIAFPW